MQATMDVGIGKLEKKSKNSMLKKLESYLSIKKNKSSSTKPANILSKSKSWHCGSAKDPSRDNNKKLKRAPHGCFCVYVGPEKQRFAIKTEYANHPLFKMLLDDAESEYGLNCEGPLLLPCDVDLFCRVLAEMDGENEADTGPAFACSPFSPARRLGKTSMAKGCSRYTVLSQSPLLKINPF